MIMPKVCVECHSFPNNFTHVTIHSITFTFLKCDPQTTINITLVYGTNADL